MIFERTRHNTPEEHLGFAILTRAVADLFIGDSHTPTQAETVRREALRFLTDKEGQWAQSRADFCTLCGVDPSLLRDRVIDILEERAELNMGDTRKEVVARLDLAQALWRIENDNGSAHRARQLAARKKAVLRVQMANVLHYLSEPRGFRQTQDRFGMGNTKMREILNALQGSGDVVRASGGKYVAASQTSVEAA